jgi:hypothetical protein
MLLVVLELALVTVTISIAEEALSMEMVVLELPLVCVAIRKYDSTKTMFFVKAKTAVIFVLIGVDQLPLAV